MLSIPPFSFVAVHTVIYALPALYSWLSVYSIWYIYMCWYHCVAIGGWGTCSCVKGTTGYLVAAAWCCYHVSCIEQIFHLTAPPPPAAHCLHLSYLSQEEFNGVSSTIIADGPLSEKSPLSDKIVGVAAYNKWYILGYPVEIPNKKVPKKKKKVGRISQGQNRTRPHRTRPGRMKQTWC